MNRKITRIRVGKFPGLCLSRFFPGPDSFPILRRFFASAILPFRLCECESFLLADWRGLKAGGWGRSEVVRMVGGSGSGMLLDIRGLGTSLSERAAGCLDNGALAGQIGAIGG